MVKKILIGNKEYILKKKEIQENKKEYLGDIDKTMSEKTPTEIIRFILESLR
jgi:hypothetical protein